MDPFLLLLCPFLACLCLILIHAYFGLHILERGIIFVDLSLAQLIGLGLSCALYFGHESHQYLWSAGFAVVGAFLLSFSRRIGHFVNIEAFIGVLYIFGLAGSILILDRTPHGLEELKSIFNGNILWVRPREVLCAAGLYGAIGLVHFIFRKKFFALSYRKTGRMGWEFLFFLTFALVLVSSVKLAGILQVFAFLVIPALIGRIFGGSPGRILLGGWAIGVAASLFGLSFSYAFDLPTAPLIVTSLCLVFFFVFIVRMIGQFRRAGGN